MNLAYLRAKLYGFGLWAIQVLRKFENGKFTGKALFMSKRKFSNNRSGFSGFQIYLESMNRKFVIKGQFDPLIHIRHIKD